MAQTNFSKHKWRSNLLNFDTITSSLTNKHRHSIQIRQWIDYATEKNIEHRKKNLSMVKMFLNQQMEQAGEHITQLHTSDIVTFDTDITDT